MPFIIALVILLVSHLTIDKDFPKEAKTAAWAIFILLGFLYFLFGVIL